MHLRSRPSFLYVLLCGLFLVGVFFFADPAAAADPTLEATSTVANFEPINWAYWDRSNTYDAIFYGWTATTTGSVCAIQIPISRYSVSTETDHQIPITIGIVDATTTDPENTTFISNTSFSAGYYSGDYPVSIQPSADAITIYFTLFEGSDTVACQTINAGQTIWVKVRDLDWPMPDTNNPMRYGQNLSYTNIGTRVCYRFGDSGTTLADECLADGSGAINILTDYSLVPFNLVFTEPTADYYSFADEDFGLVGNYIRDVLKYLFTPSSESLQMYEDSQNLLATKVPFGFFAYASSSLGELGAEATTTTPIGFHVSSTAGDVFAISEDVEVFNPSEIEALIPPALLTMIRAIAAVVMWFLFFTWIWAVATNRGGEETGGV